MTEQQQDALPKYQAPKVVKHEDPRGKRVWAVTKQWAEDGDKDDDHLASLAPGRLTHMSLNKGVHNRKVIPDWMEAS